MAANLTSGMSSMRRVRSEKRPLMARLSSNDRAIPESLRVRAYRTDPKGQLLGPLQANTCRPWRCCDHFDTARPRKTRLGAAHS